MDKKLQFDLLFARPGFVAGMGSAFDLWGSLPEYNESCTPGEADANAIYTDWAIVGQDILNATQACAADNDLA